MYHEQPAQRKLIEWTGLPYTQKTLMPQAKSCCHYMVAEMAKVSLRTTPREVGEKIG